MKLLFFTFALLVMPGVAFADTETGAALATTSAGPQTHPPARLAATRCAVPDRLQSASPGPGRSKSHQPPDAGSALNRTDPWDQCLIGDPHDPPISIATGSGMDPDFDPLSGSGAVSRSDLTQDVLLHGSDPGTRVDLSAYAVPANAAMPDDVFEGSLELVGEAISGAFEEIRDTQQYTGDADTTRKHLPEFNFEFVQTGTHLLAVERGSLTDSHPEWEYILEAGRVWKENGDGDFSRASLPFTLHQKNANCMHNGVLTFLFRNDGSVSKVAYQVSSETCLYFQFDMWGLLNTTYTPAAVSGADGLRAAYQAEVEARIPVKPIAALAADYPGTDPGEFGSAAEVNPEYLTTYGFIIDGVHYSGGCHTRHGDYPFCNHLDLPSYSTAKSVFAGLALLRMELKHSGFLDHSVADFVPACDSNGNWDDVTYGQAIDMATGNYDLAQYMGDEGASHTSNLLQSLDHATKINYSCTQYARKASPGSKWVYHTSDTYILGTAMNADLKSLEGGALDIFRDVLVGEILAPLGTSPGSHVSRRTYDTVQQPFTGWGMTFLPDDVARLAEFLNVDDGRINGQLVVDSFELEAALQRDASDRGLEPLAGYRYNNGFWARNIKSVLGCPTDVWVPFMSGFGGITVLLLPNDTAYYVFSDNDTFAWLRAAQESHAIRSLCP